MVSLLFVVALIVALHTLLGALTVPIYGALSIDAIGHTIVGGIAGGFLFCHSLYSPIIFIGAIFSVFAMYGVVEFLKKSNHISVDSALGIAFSLFFSLGILIISLCARSVHLDLDMVLLGNIEYILCDIVELPFFSISVPKILGPLSVLLLFLLVIHFFFHKHIVAILFDEKYAKIRRVQPWILRMVVIALNACGVVVSLSAIGTIAIVGVVITPFLFFWSSIKRYHLFLIYSVVMNILLSFFGTAVALWLNLPIAATVALFLTTIGFIFIIVRIFFTRVKLFRYNLK